MVSLVRVTNEQFFFFLLNTKIINKNITANGTKSKFKSEIKTMNKQTDLTMHTTSPEVSLNRLIVHKNVTYGILRPPPVKLTLV